MNDSFFRCSKANGPNSGAYAGTLCGALNQGSGTLTLTFGGMFRWRAPTLGGDGAVFAITVHHKTI